MGLFDMASGFSACSECFDEACDCLGFSTGFVSDFSIFLVTSGGFVFFPWGTTFVCFGLEACFGGWVCFGLVTSCRGIDGWGFLS